jgi:hypothetical protein
VYKYLCLYCISKKKISTSSFSNLPIVCARASWVLNLSASNPAGGCISKTKLNAHHDLGRTAVVFLKMATVGKLNWRWTLRMYMLLSPWSPAESNAAYDVLYSCVCVCFGYICYRVCARCLDTFGGLLDAVPPRLRQQLYFGPAGNAIRPRGLLDCFATSSLSTPGPGAPIY